MRIYVDFTRQHSAAVAGSDPVVQLCVKMPNAAPDLTPRRAHGVQPTAALEATLTPSSPAPTMASFMASATNNVTKGRPDVKDDDGTTTPPEVLLL